MQEKSNENAQPLSQKRLASTIESQRSLVSAIATQKADIARKLYEKRNDAQRISCAIESLNKYVVDSGLLDQGHPWTGPILQVTERAEEVFSKSTLLLPQEEIKSSEQDEDFLLLCMRGDGIGGCDLIKELKVHHQFPIFPNSPMSNIESACCEQESCAEHQKVVFGAESRV